MQPGLLRVYAEKTLADGTKLEVVEEYNTVLMAIGREAATKDCGFDLVGIETTSSGKVGTYLPSMFGVRYWVVVNRVGLCLGSMQLETC